MKIYNTCSLVCLIVSVKALSNSSNNNNNNNRVGQKQQQQQQQRQISRRIALLSTTSTIFGAATVLQPKISYAAGADDIPDKFNVDEYLRTGFVSNPMGVSGQAGKSKPETGVLLRSGSEVSRDSRTGDVLAEILLQSSDNDLVPVLASFVSPWPLAVGTVFDVECRNANTGDGVFLAVSNNIGSKPLSDIKDTYIVNELTKPSGRFSFYGTPTDIKIRDSYMKDSNYKVIDISFSTLSQSTQTEIPRRARIVATIPDGTQQVVMLIGSSSTTRWNKQDKGGSKELIASIADSFRAIPAPTSSLKMRPKDRRATM